MTALHRVSRCCSRRPLWALPGGLAADYDPPIVVDQAAEYVPVEVGSGWYLRGDVGYNFSDSAVPSFLRSARKRATRHIAGSIGVGYHFTDYVRAELNFGFLSQRPASMPRTASTRSAFENNVWSGMANGYVDLGTYVRLHALCRRRHRPHLFQRTTIDVDAPSVPARIRRADDTQYKVRLCADGRHQLPGLAEHLGRCRLSNI